MKTNDLLQHSLQFFRQYKYYFLSLLLFLSGAKLMALAPATAVPDCKNQNVIEKLKGIVSAQLARSEYAVNKVSSVFDVSQIDEPNSSSRTCRAGLTIEGSELGSVNYLISIAAPGSKERFTLDTTLD
jgi:hypothetical protein